MDNNNHGATRPNQDTQPDDLLIYDYNIRCLNMMKKQSVLCYAMAKVNPDAGKAGEPLSRNIRKALLNVISLLDSQIDKMSEIFKDIDSQIVIERLSDIDSQIGTKRQSDIDSQIGINRQSERDKTTVR